MEKIEDVVEELRGLKKHLEWCDATLFDIAISLRKLTKRPNTEDEPIRIAR